MSISFSVIVVESHLSDSTVLISRQIYLFINDLFNIHYLFKPMVLSKFQLHLKKYPVQVFDLKCPLFGII